jgi:hypothetical protein
MIEHTSLLDGLRELASLDLQIRLWLDGEDDQMSSFTEAICKVFDDSGLTRIVEANELKKYFPDEICSRINNLDRLINCVPEFAEPHEIVEHPEMNQIRLVAAELLKLLGTK